MEETYTPQVGDKVTWTHTYRRGHSMTLSTREGKIIEVCKSMATAKMRNGTQHRLPHTAFTQAGKRSQLTRMFNPSKRRDEHSK